MRPSAHTLTRKAFRVSRLAEFASVAELTKTTGHPVRDWPLVIVKELADNALDAAEEAGVPPSIEIVVDEDSITVADRGPGIAPDTVASLVDYSVRTSSRAAYVSPTRGAQGNALQSIIPMGFALASLPSDIEELFDALGDTTERMSEEEMAQITTAAEGGRSCAVQDAAVLIESRGVAHRIGFAVDPVRQTPVISHASEPSDVKIGTRVVVRWPNSASSIVADAEDDFLQLASTFAWLNPHLTLSAEWRAADPPVHFRREATDSGWRKWGPSQPTSPHWYSVERLGRRMAAEIAHTEDHGTARPSVRELVVEFRGLKGTDKARDICREIGAERLSLEDFYARGAGAAAALLSAMKLRSRPVRPRELGVVGSDHLRARFAESGSYPETFVYRSAEVEHDGLPYVIEAAFALRSGEDDGEGPRIIEGFNFTPAIGASPFQLEGHLAQARIEDDDPVTVFVHLTSPRLDFLDRGKARVALPHAVDRQLTDLVKGIAAKWTKLKKAEIRDRQAYWRRADAMRRRNRPMTAKEAAWQVMESAYLKASAQGSLPANPRQIMYAARDSIQKATGKSLNSQYFSQTLLVDYVDEKGVSWDIAWDDRGHFSEPHTSRKIGLGTLAVRGYLRSRRGPAIHPAAIVAATVTTSGPNGRYGAALFLEKEGFAPILEVAAIAERFDIAILSTKGMSVTAARELVDALAGDGVRLFTLHDFDIAGFSIRKTLTESGPRYRFSNKLDFVDVGLRLADVERLGLESEGVIVDKDKDALAHRLRINGATKEEIAFLLAGQRVELNAMPSDVFVQFVEDGLSRHGVMKVVPSKETVERTYVAFRRAEKAKEALEAELERLNEESVKTPTDLENRIREYLAAHPKDTWEGAIREIADRDDA